MTAGSDNIHRRGTPLKKARTNSGRLVSSDLENTSIIMSRLHGSNAAPTASSGDKPRRVYYSVGLLCASFTFCLVMGMEQLRGILGRLNSGNSLGRTASYFASHSTTTDSSYHPGCQSWPGIMSPLQVEQELLTPQDDEEEEKAPPSGLVISMLLGDHMLPYICHFFPSQLAHLIVPQGLDVLLVIPKPKKNTTTTITMRALQKCLNLVPLPTDDDDTDDGYVYQDWQNLDGSTMTTWEHRAPSFSFTTRIFLAETDLQLPPYVQANRSAYLDDTSDTPIAISPKSCQAPLTYVQGTRWYIYEMLHLQILQQYDYFFKVDSDVVFTKTIPIQLTHDMTVRGAVFAHFAKYPDRVQTPCADTVAAAVRAFSRQSAHLLVDGSNNNNNSTKTWNGHYCSGDQHPLLTVDSDRYYSNFIIGRTDYFTSPGPLQLGKFLSHEWTQGFFRHRWGDQAYWHFALGLFLHNFEDAVVDYTEFRCAPEPNCWMSSQDGKRIPDAANLCRNPSGSFLHTKAWQRFANRWNRWSALDHLSPRDVKPYRTTYKHDCRNSTRWKRD
ncbi:expressed unknown protein [Seminavis robusta]|uniref:Nucleotide-diphospho-sugar transferase n=1 Tax=Seminavis robusta TaxID=568900 RepID=A0A9N8E123_9STRA|nr:expressed unknown protein [Seminavis robusta]|eukprot:Sro516_g158530.1 n/a (554) ;mRNA; f:34086-35747